MSFFSGGLQGVATGPGSGLRFASTRGRIQGSPSNGMNYPSPFFDIGHTYLPVTVKALLRWCRYYFMTNPLLNAGTFKMAEYPVTDLLIEHENPSVQKRWSEYFHEHFMYPAFQIEVGLDYFTYGNAFITIYYPVRKWLKCRQCGHQDHEADLRSNYIFTNFEFRLTCPRCGHVGTADVKQQYLKNASEIRLVRWNPEDVEIDVNDITGAVDYYYIIPPAMKNDITVGKKSVVGEIPQIFIQAVRENKGVKFAPDNFFHLKRPSLANLDRGWGTPLLLPVLKDAYYLQIMKKAQEAILLEHIIPLRILFPQAGSASSDPYTTINLTQWREHVAGEIARWRYDPNYIPVMPLPVGHQTLGGDGRALLLSGEIQQWSDHLVVGMGVPREFIFGGMSYAGTNVSMRMLENAFLRYISRHLALSKFVMKSVSKYMDWPEATCKFKPFKMADDLQRKMFLLNVNAQGKISDTSFLAECDYDQSEENKIMLRENKERLEALKDQQVAQAEAQGEAMLVNAKYQAKMNQVMMQAQQAPVAPGEPGGPEQQMQGGGPGGQGAQGEPIPGGQPAEQMQPQAQQSEQGYFQQQVGSPLNMGQDMQSNQMMNIDLPSMAMQQARMIIQLPPEQQQTAIQNLEQQSPELAELVRQYLTQLQPQSGGGGVDMRPQPNVYPERRETPMVT